MPETHTATRECLLCEGRGETWVDLRGTIGTCIRCDGTGIDPGPED